MSASQLRRFLWATCLVGLAAISLLSCASAIPVPQEVDLTRGPTASSRATLENLREGRQLYVDHCGGCHRLRPPGELRADEWVQALASMRHRVRLSPLEEERMLSFLRQYASSDGP